jgi:hypothetical protein
MVGIQQCSVPTEILRFAQNDTIIQKAIIEIK